MPKGIVNWKKFEKFLLYVGCEFTREKGDHRVYWRADIKRPIVISRDSVLPPFVIRNNLRILGISWDEFLNILERI